MKRPFALLLLFALFLLVGCKSQVGSAEDPIDGTASSDPHALSEALSSSDGSIRESTLPDAETGNDTQASGSDNAPQGVSSGSDGESQQPTYPAPTGEPWVSDVPIERTEPVELNGLRFTSFGRYSGAFFEDGSDKAVEDVAIVLVINTTDRYLELATFSFEIDGEPATFSVTNLPPQKGAWVMERNALTVSSGASFVLKSGTTNFRTPEEIPAVSAQPLDGTILVENFSETEAFSGYIYYKAVYTDGNYLGGVTYRSPIEALPAMSSTEITAAHCDGTSEIVCIARTE